MALPVAMLSTVAALGLAGATVMTTTGVQRGSKRDNSSKSAIAAADAGANVAMQRLNRNGGLLNGEKPCLILNAEDELVAGPADSAEPGWCAPIEGEVGGAAYSYRVNAWGSDCGPEDICIVSTGTAGEVSRRIELSLDENGLWEGLTEKDILEKKLEIAELEEKSQEELKQIENEIDEAGSESSGGGGIAGLIGREHIAASGNSDIRVGVATNGDLVTSGNTTICGDIQVGIGKTWSHSGNASQCSGYSYGEGNLELPPVSSFIPADIATNNSNGRITKCSGGGPPECQEDTYNGSWSSTKPFNPDNRSISLSGNTILTLGGGDYWVCSMSLSGNSKLIMAKGAHVRLFFDTPENCGNPNQISMSGNNEITSTGYQPSLGEYDVPGFYLLGSTSWTSQVALSGNYSSTNEFVVYAPDSYISVSGNATFKGIIAGKQIAWSGNGKIEQDSGFEAPEVINPGGDNTLIEELEESKITLEEAIEKLQEELELLENELASESGGRFFNAQGYVECSGGAAAAGAAPDAGC
jgi:hypothetical protein